MVLEARAIKDTAVKIYDYRMAAQYLGMSEEVFLTYANISGLLSFRLIFNTKVYTESELIRFKNVINTAKET